MPSLAMLALMGCAKNTVVEAPVQEPAMAASPTIVSSPTDDRTYLYFELENGLRVVAISDPNTDSAAAALDVHIGQFSDPFDRQGLSHFLEHMLFMGTEKYPDVDGYRKFIQDHGGGSNAGTGQEHTTYFFNIDQPYLEPALDRFAQFFISPKLDPEYVDRERNAVNAEYSLKIKDEARRNREVRRVTHNPDHPFRKFSVGNLETLGDREDDRVWDDLKTHYESTYSASRMAMSVIGREDVQTLKAMVVEKMSAVPSDGERKQYSKVAPFLPEQLGVRIQVTPLQDVRSIEMTFPGPRSDTYWAEHPMDFITNLMGQEGEGSLHSLLKSRGWIEELYSYSNGTEDYASVVVGADLTEEGYQHIDDIVDLTFQYARLVARDGVKASYHDESARISTLGFQFSSEKSPSSAVRQARLLQSYPPENFNNAEAFYGDFDADLVNLYLDAMVPSNLRLFVHGPDLETDEVEPLYGTPYSIRPLEPALLERWQSSETDAALTLPAANPFIAENVSLRDADEAAVPKQLLDEPGLSLWHDQDVEFGTPHTRAEILINYPVADTRAQVINRLMVSLINDSLETWRFQPSQAGVYASVWNADRGMQISLSGYNEKQPELLAVVSERIMNFEVDEARFAAKKAEQIRDWSNFDKQRPMTQTYAAVGQLFGPLNYTPEQGLAILEDVDAADVQAFAKSFSKGASARVLVHGNTTAEQALALTDSVKKQFLGDKFADVRPEEYRRLLQGRELVFDLDVDHNDSTIITSYQGQTPDLKEQALYLLVGQVMKTPFFTELRTNQQLGYSVRASYTRWDNLPGLTLAIQSAAVGPVTLQVRIDAFLEDFRVTLTDMPEAEFETIRAGLVASLTEKDTTLRQRSNRYSDDLYRGFTQFDRKVQLAEVIGSTNKAAVLALYNERITADAGRLIVRSFGQAHQDEVPKKGGCATRECVTQQLTERYVRAL